VSDLTELRRQLREAGRYMLDNDLAWGNAGNISARVSDDGGTEAAKCLIAASGTEMGALQDDDLVLCAIEPQAGKAESYRRKPSKELPMHRAVYQARPEIGAVLHSSPFYGTLVACSQIELPGNWFVEDMYYLERVARVPYHHPGSQALADAVQQQAMKANVLLLQNHGVLVYDSNVREALMALHTLELVCRMVVTMRSANIEPQSLPADTVHDFLNNAGYRPRRQWP
jgi:L-fuculose-phosphate aldolase